MRRKKTSRRVLESLCLEPGAEDGVDPRHDVRTRSNPVDRKTVQLAGQVRRTLDLVLAGESHDPVLLDLRIVSVEPAPDSTCFRIVVTGDVEEAPALEALGRAASWLRGEVAAAVNRRKAPLLAFRFLPGREVRP